MFADPSKLTPLIVLAVCRTVADPALPLTVVWSPVFVPDDVPLNVPDCVASVPRLNAVRAAVASTAVISDLPTDVVSMTCVAITASTPTEFPYSKSTADQRVRVYCKRQNPQGLKVTLDYLVMVP
jgi:hypothetical protein